MLKHAEMLFKAVGDRTRLRILKMLGAGPLCVCQIVETLKLSQSTVSKHLSILSGVDLVDSAHRGKWTFYKLAKPETPEARRLLAAVKCCASEDPEVARDLAKVGEKEIQSLATCHLPGRGGKARKP